MEKFTQPPFLKQNDTIGIVAPARKVQKEDILQAAKIFESWGLKVVYGKNLFAEENQFAGSDELRKNDFQQMLDDENIKAIVCARGGYGVSRIIDHLNFNKFLQKPKWIIGYSDIGVLHCHINTNFKIQTLHSAMPAEFPSFQENSLALTSLRQQLFGEIIAFPSVESHPLYREGIAEGILVGGNLSILYSIQNTASEIDTTGKILFIEDLDEYLYHIDRMMENLKRSGKLSNLKALVVGGMTKMHDNGIPFGKTAEEIIADKVREYNYPVLFNFPAGHVEENNFALRFGEKYKLEVLPNKLSLTISEN